jgi:hypothetical protein
MSTQQPSGVLRQADTCAYSFHCAIAFTTMTSSFGHPVAGRPQTCAYDQ